MPHSQNVMLMDWVLELKLKSFREALAPEVSLNDGGDLHLYTNNYTPTPLDVPADYTEANYDTYQPLSIDGAFNAPVKLQDGLWGCRTNLITFPNPGAGGPFTIYGVYMTVVHAAQTKVLLASRFPEPFTLEIGGDTLALRLRFDEWASLQLVIELLSE